MRVSTIVTFETKFQARLEIPFDTYGRYLAIVAEAYFNHISRLIQSHGIERYYFQLLHICQRDGQLTQKDLGELIQRDKVSVLRAVDYLAERGLIRREESCTDRRCQILFATEAGKSLVPVIRQAITETNKVFFHAFSKEEKEVFITSIEKLMAVREQLPDPEFIIHAEKRSKDDK